MGEGGRSTEAIRIGVFGRGRLGGSVGDAIREADDVLAWQVAREDPPPAPVDCAVDASVGAALEPHLAWALETRTPLVAATTGWELPDLAERVGDRIGFLAAPNLSLTVALVARLARVLARFGALDEERDPYVLEHHHAAKRDAPSGTARLLAEAILAESPRKRRWVVAAGEGPLDASDLSVAAIRAGSTGSYHVVGLDAPGETVELVHRARDHSPYAAGAIAAARWLVGRTGTFTMDDVARELLDPLFSPHAAGGG